MAIKVTWTAGYKDVVLNRNGDNFTLSWTPPTATRKVGDSDKDVSLRYQYIFVRLYGTVLTTDKETGEKVPKKVAGQEVTGFIYVYRAYVSGSTNTVTFTVNITAGTGTTGKPIKKVDGQGTQGKPNVNSTWVPLPFTNANIRLDSLRVYMVGSVSKAHNISHKDKVYGYSSYTSGGIDADKPTKAWGDASNPNTAFTILAPTAVRTKDGEAFVTHVGRNDSMLKCNVVDNDFYKFRIDMSSGTDDTSRKWFYRLRWKLVAYALNRKQNSSGSEYDFKTPFEPNAYVKEGNNYVLYKEGGFNGSKYDHVADENGSNRFNDLSLSNSGLYFKDSSTGKYTWVPTDGSVPIYLLFCTKTQGPHGDSPWKILSFHWAKPEIPVVSSVTHTSKYLGKISSIVQIRARINPLRGWSPIGLGRRPASLAAKVTNKFPNDQIIEHYYVGDYLKLYYARGVPTSTGFLSSDASFEELQSVAMQYWNEEYIDFYHQRGYVDLGDDEAEFYMLEACHLPFEPVKSWQFRANCGKVKPPSSVSYDALAPGYKTVVTAMTETALTGVKYALVIKLKKPGDPTPKEDVVKWNGSSSQTPPAEVSGTTVSFGTKANPVNLSKYLTDKKGNPIPNLVFTLGVKALPPDLPNDISRYSKESVYVDGKKSGIRGQFLESDVTWAVSDMFPGTLTKLSIEPISGENSIKVSWTGATTTYDTVEISWSDDPKAWSSTNQPSTFEVEDPNARTWYITGLEAGKTYYVRTRIKYDETSSRSEVFGPYSLTKDINLVSVPATPTITAVSTKLPYDSREPVDLSWTYENEDGSTVAKSVLNVKTYNSSNSLLKNTDVNIEGSSLARRIFLFDRMNVPVGGHCDITVRVSSKNGAESETSDPVRIFFGAVPEITAPENLGGTSSVISAGNVADGYVSASPITVRFATTSRLSGRVELVRCSNVRREKADGSIVYGFEGDVAWSVPIQSNPKGSSVASPESVTMDLDLSQGEQYRVRIFAANDFGESVFEGRTLTVDLDHRAIKPELVSVSEGAELGSAYVGAARPSGAASSDSLDIYRITTDGPQLVRSGADWMVDGHPETLVLDLLSPQRKNGPAYRFVTRTSDGDESWLDVSWRGTVPMGLLVTYGEQTALFQWNAAPNIKWDKSFYENKHMGGKVTGGWGQAVSKNGTFSFDVINYDEEDIFDAIAEIGEYPGPCYVRAPHGIGFYANINPSYTRKQNELLTNVSFSYTRVDYAPDRSEQD